MKTAETVRLITKADDVGSNHAANRAFYDAYKQGILRNGVIMTCCAGAEEAAALFRNEPGFTMGLHLTLNSEWERVKWGPVLPPGRVPSLVDGNGHFFQFPKQTRDNAPVLHEVMAELQAQLDRARSLGLDIRFADAHMGFPWILDGLEDAIRRWCGDNGILYNPSDYPELPEAASTGDPVEQFLARLRAAKPGLYYMHMGHPAYDWPEMGKLGHEGYWDVAPEREWDRLRLMDRRVVEYFRDNPVEAVQLPLGG